MQPYEEREYRCLGQWKEGDFVYTYTQRTDAAAHECFVGSITSEEEIYIIEAGEHCNRKLNPLDYGMKLVRQGSCTTGEATTERPIPPPFRPAVPTTAPPRPSRPSSVIPPWKTLTDRPLVEVESNDFNRSPVSSSSSILQFLVLLLTCFRLIFPLCS